MRLPQVLPVSFYAAPVLEVAQALLGQWICVDGYTLCIGRIVEVEAYGLNDRASHAYDGRRTPRNAAMYAPAGRAYVYVCYGIHMLFNVVCEQENVPAAVLIRAVEPILGEDTMRVRRGGLLPRKHLTAGPGRLTEALGITKAMNGASLQSKTLRIVQGAAPCDNEVYQTTRVGVESAGEDARKPWRFYIRGNPFVSAL